jgi:DUF971 family protein
VNAADKPANKPGDMFPKAVPDEGSYESSTAPWPTELRLFKEEARLEIEFSDGHTHSLPAEYLRVESPSAEVQGHGPGEKRIVAERAHVGILDLESVGNYAVRIKFDDLHDTGIYSWEYLYRLGVEHDRRWREYLAALKKQGLSREPKRG